MCGRFTQVSSITEFIKELSPQLELPIGYDDTPLARYNVPPQTSVKIFRANEKQIIIETVHWGWKPHWAIDMQPTINARLDKVSTSKFYTQIWPHRCLIPANGWFEWVNEGTIKQPYYIQLKTKKPMFFAGIGHFKEGSDNNGFVIITTDADGGLTDIHDRKPIVLSPKLANEWLDLNTDKAKAEQILRKNSRKQGDFNWFPVGKAVGSVRNQGPELIKQI